MSLSIYIYIYNFSDSGYEKSTENITCRTNSIDKYIKPLSGAVLNKLDPSRLQLTKRLGKILSY